MTRGFLFERRIYFAASGNGDGAAGVEVAATGRVDRGRYVTFQDDALTFGLSEGIGDGNR